MNYDTVNYITLTKIFHNYTISGSLNNLVVFL